MAMPTARTMTRKMPKERAEEPFIVQELLGRVVSWGTL
jgi:hypothetical protein